METNNKISWAVPAYQHSKKSVDWFWALGIIIVAGTVTAILFENYFFAILLVLGGILMGYFANEEPETLYYEFDKEGLRIKDRLYPYASIKAYYVDLKKNPTLFIKTDRFFLPIIPFAINENVSVKITEILIAKNIPEEEMKESPVEQVMELIGY